MKLRSAVVLGVVLGSVASLPVYADTSSAGSTGSDDNQLIQALTQRTNLLEKEVQQLKSSLKKMRSAKATAVPATPRSGILATPAQVVPVSTSVSAKPAPKSVSSVGVLSDQLVYLGGMPVTTSPYLGIDSEFNGSDLMVNFPFINTDLLLLQQRQKLNAAYIANNFATPTHPYLELSGEVQGTAFAQRGPGRSTSDIDLTDAEIDAAALINPWVLGYMTLTYDNTPPALGDGPRVANSRVTIQRGFITLGNLDQSPFYGTVGQLYVPFGQYSSSMIADPLTKTLARAQERAVVLGYQSNIGAFNSFNAQAFTYKGDTSISRTSTSTVNEGGLNASFIATHPNWNASLGGGYLSNLADSLGMQSNNASTGFEGFGTQPSNTTINNIESLVHRVPALDVNGNLGAGDYNLIAEYVSAINPFSAADMTFDNHGAKPSALNVELSYNIPIATKPTSFAVGYGNTHQALALLLPEQRYVAVVNTSLWRDTVESLELRHDIYYGSGTSAAGQGVAVDPAGTLGRATNTLTAQFSIFF